MEPTNRTTTAARPRGGSMPTQSGSTQAGSTPGGSSGRASSFEDDIERRRFVTVIRGYDRIEVDEYVDDLLAVVTTLRTSAAEAEKARRTAEERAAAAERKAESAGSQPAAAPTEGFGMRAERLLRLAENEAAEIRAGAAAESSAIVERARADAEQFRHESEQALISRSAQSDQEAARRTAALDEREGSLKAQVEAARGEIEMLTRAAQREADRLRDQARHEIEEKRAAAETAATRAVEAVEKDVARLNSLRESTRQELARIVEIVRTASSEVAGQGTASDHTDERR